VRFKRHKEESGKRSKSRILRAASKLFVENGFAGTSLSEVAKKIDVNQSLIYHYFSSKEELWQCVKEELIGGYFEANRTSFEVDKGLRYFLEQYFHSGYDYFCRHPDIIRILSWQSLEGELGKLATLRMSDQDMLMQAVMSLKEQGEIRSAQDPFIAILMIRNALRAPFFDDYAAFDQDLEKEKKYVKIAVDCLMRAFAE